MKKNSTAKSLETSRRSKIRKIRKILGSIQGVSMLSVFIFSSGVDTPSGDINILDCILLLICGSIGFITSYILGDVY